MQNTASAVPVIFNMRTFLNYYKDPANPDIFIDPNPPITKYYKTKDILETKQLEPQYITIDGQKIYIKNYVTYVKDKKSKSNKAKRYEKILFSIPTEINGELWDFHYHFGLSKELQSKRKTRKSSGNITGIYFHKTIQEPNLNNKDQINCYFENGIEIEDISDIKCFSHETHRMKNKFPITSDDFKYLQEIIRRPFYGVTVAGGRKRAIKYMRTRRTKKKRFSLKTHS
jgi:hypothetical protein